MGLLSEEQKEAALKKLNEMCIANQYRIGTGFLTTYQILSVLSEGGYIDTAYRMLENTKQPGWLFAVTKGATTVWGNWYGINEKGEPVDSHNHYAPGAVVAWLFSHCAGITPLKPGFEEVRIRPMPGGSLLYARAEYESIRGTIISDWKIENGNFILSVVVPKEVTAEICMPNGEVRYVEEGTHKFSCML